MPTTPKASRKALGNGGIDTRKIEAEAVRKRESAADPDSLLQSRLIRDRTKATARWPLFLCAASWIPGALYTD